MSTRGRIELDAEIALAHRLHGEVAELEAAMPSLPRFDPRTSNAQRRYCELLIRSARLKQSAIRRAIASVGRLGSAIAQEVEVT